MFRFKLRRTSARVASEATTVVKLLFFICFFVISVNVGLGRSSYRRCSLKKDVLKNFAKFTRNKRCFPMNFEESLGTSFLP